ncbi:MAG TPA: ABC transporter substrate-binding protein [Stellaceae bacterium]|nr:ABC transporter substrate-binding protein [Stellaceae bacterium]
MPTIGVLVVQSLGWKQFLRLFKESMRRLGYVEGQNVRFEVRSDQGDRGRLPELAAGLVRLKVDVIVGWLTPAGTAAKQATREIPVVCAICGNPVETGLVESLARPGGNVTGIAGVGAELAGKTVELIRDMLPSARRIAILANAPDPFSKPFVEKIRLAGNATGIAIDAIMLPGPQGVEAAFVGLGRDPPDAVIVQPTLGLERPAALALKDRLPSASILSEFVDVGGLMSYAAAEADAYESAAGYVDKLLKGAKPADLPVQQPTRFELVINLKTAKALGLTIPHSFVLRADKVIE